MKLRGLRGSILEEMINNTISIYRKKNLALIQKIPTPIVPTKINSKGQIILAYFDKKSTVDYIGVVQEIPVCFDAKECDKNAFSLQNIHAHQIAFMRDFEKQGGASFLLILFKTINKVYYMRFNELDRILRLKQKSFKIDSLDEKYFIDIKGKIKFEFLDKLQFDINEREISE